MATLDEEGRVVSDDHPLQVRRHFYAACIFKLFEKSNSKKTRTRQKFKLDVLSHMLDSSWCSAKKV